MPRKYEKSSGWVVYRKNGEKVEILLLKWLNSRNKEELVIPKGKIEQWEVAKDTALREISEEAGVAQEDLEIIKFVTKLTYTYTAGYLKGNPVIDKDVYLFIVRYNGNAIPIVRKEERFVWYKWVDIEKVKDLSVRFDLSWIIYRNKPFFI
jgi:8-oxo-dGTP pyrophosphatase MutT (NUDIX family)